MSDRTPLDGRSSSLRVPAAPKSSRQRSAVSNGTKAFIEGDERGPWTRRFKDLLALHLEDLGHPEHLSEAQNSIARRCATLEVQLEQMEAQASLGNDFDMDLYQRASNTLGRLLDRLGIKRERREKTLAEQMREIEGR